MEIRKLLTIDEQLQADKISTLAFAGKMNVEESRKKYETEPPRQGQDRWGAFDDNGKVIAGIINNRYTVYFDGHPVGCTGIGDVSTLPEKRRQGAIRAIMKAILTESREKGDVLGALYPFSHSFYRKFGFELVQSSVRQFVRTELLQHLPLTHHPELQEGNGEYSEIIPLSHEFLKKYNLGLIRRDFEWRHIAGDPYNDRRLRYLFRNDEGKLCGYLCFSPDYYPDINLTRVNISEMGYDSKECLMSIFAFISRLSAKYEEVTGKIPPETDLTLMVTEPYNVRQERSCAGMARVLNVPEAFRLMKAPYHKGEVTICVEDDFLPENSGNYTICYEGGKVISVEITDKIPDLECPVNLLAPLMLGANDPEATFMSAPELKVNSNYEELCLLFPKKLIYMNQNF